MIKNTTLLISLLFIHFVSKAECELTPPTLLKDTISVCFGSAFSAIEVESNNPINWYYQGKIIQAGNAYKPSFTEAGEYKIQCTQTDNLCESDSTTLLLKVVAKPDIPRLPEKYIVCEGDRIENKESLTIYVDSVGVVEWYDYYPIYIESCELEKEFGLPCNEGDTIQIEPFQTGYSLNTIPFINLGARRTIYAIRTIDGCSSDTAVFEFGVGQRPLPPIITLSQSFSDEIYLEATSGDLYYGGYSTTWYEKNDSLNSVIEANDISVLNNDNGKTFCAYQTDNTCAGDPTCVTYKDGVITNTLVHSQNPINLTYTGSSLLIEGVAVNNANIHIYSTDGRLIYMERGITALPKSIALPNLTSGIYKVMISNKTKQYSIVESFIVE